MKRLLLLCCLAASGCSIEAVRLKGYAYVNEKDGVDEKDELIENSSTRSHRLMLIRALDEIAASETLDTNFAGNLGTIQYRLFFATGDLGGKYHPGENHVQVNASPFRAIGSRFSADEFLEGQYMMEGIISHELAHSFWEKKLPIFSQFEFRKIVKEYYGAHLRLKETLGKAYPSDRLMEEICLTKSEAQSLRNFFSFEDFYKKYYGEKFESYFLGTEAFAKLFELEVAGKMAASRVLQKASSGTLDCLTAEICALKMINLDLIPQNLRRFFPGLLNERYFLGMGDMSY
ncbi:hypothetical protein HYU13_05790 [Candidatus Woesearchaeota archaeon]|nr:hypothetical protein [Candidatus Woesearchaeota archaeon]